MDQYFAARETPELLNELEGRIKSYNNYLDGSGVAARAKRAEDVYFGRHQGESGVGSYSITDSGTDGEMSAVPTNKLRTLVKHQLSYTTTQKPAWDPKARNSDTKSGQQARLSINVLDYYLGEKRLGRHMGQACERSLVSAKGYIYMPWDPSLGSAYATAPAIDPQTKQPILDESGKPKLKVVYEGDVSCSSKGWRDVIYDSNVRDWTKHKWIIVKEYENKWDLAARHPDMAEEIAKCGPDADFDFSGKFNQRTWDEKSQQDIIPVFYFYHLKTDGLKSGRFTKFIGTKKSLYDGAMQYRRLPVFRIAPGEQFDTCEGYTDAFDQMALQEAVNVLISTAFSNLQAYAGQKLWLPEGCEISPSLIDDGMAILKGGVPGSEPKVLNLTSIPKELMEFLDFAQKLMVEGMGLNSVVTGDPDHGLKSGTALARMQAMAIQYSNNLQRSWAELQEDVGTFLIELLQDFAKTKRMIAISGIANRNAVKEFTGDDLNGIQRVGVGLGNAAMRTPAGVLNFAEMLYDKGEINGREFIHINSTGSFDAIAERKESDIELVQMENELMRDGKPVRAMVGDGHLYHMEQHRAVLSDPQLRTWVAQGDQMAMAIAEAATAHIQEHEQIYNTQPPIFSIIAKEPPAPQPMMPPPGGPMPGPGGPPPQGGPPMQMPEGPPPGAPPEPPPLPPVAA